MVGKMMKKKLERSFVSRTRWVLSTFANEFTQSPQPPPPVPVLVEIAKKGLSTRTQSRAEESLASKISTTIKKVERKISNTNCTRIRARTISTLIRDPLHVLSYSSLSSPCNIFSSQIENKLRPKQQKENQDQNHDRLNFRLLSSSATTKLSIPDDEYDVIVVGGGIIGTSVAYHLGKHSFLEQKSNRNSTPLKVLLLEQNKLTSGTTWHAAGLMTSFGSLSSTSIEMRKYTQQLYSTILPDELAELDEHGNQNQTDSYNSKGDVGFRSIGFIELATSYDRMDYLHRVAAYNRFCGIDGIHEIKDLERIQQDYCPIVTVHDVVGGYFSKNDGRVNPTDVTMALAKVAKLKYNVEIMEGLTVTNIVSDPSPHTSVSGWCGPAPLPRRVTGVVVEATSPAVMTTDDENNNHLHSHGKQQEQTKQSIFLSSKYVVNCTGMWGRQLGQLNGVTIPLQAAEHYYLLTDDLNMDNSKWPVIEDPSKYMYMRPEGKGLLIGFFEPIGAPWNNKSNYLTKNLKTSLINNDIPNHFAFGELEPDWDRMGPFIETAFERLLPEISRSIGIKKLFCGPESFTPDNSPIVGPVSNVLNYYVAAGLNSIGILTGGGIGRTLSQWIIQNGISPTNIDTTSIRANRFHSYQLSLPYRVERVCESLGNTYKLLHPHNQHQQPFSCRNVKHSPLHNRLIQAGAVFRDVSGWESPLYYDIHRSSPSPSPVSTEINEKSEVAPSLLSPVLSPSSKSNDKDKRETSTLYFSQRPDWFSLWEQEHIACRNNVVLFDMSFMSKYLVYGRDAGYFLNYLSTANIINNNSKNSNKYSGIISYTQWLNELGYMEADVTISKLPRHPHHYQKNSHEMECDDSSAQYLVVATDTMHHHVYAHMINRLLHGSPKRCLNVGIIDVTSQYAKINIQGPQSRELLKQVAVVVGYNNKYDCNDMFSNENFPFRSVQNVSIGYATDCFCARITYVGELGYELYIPVEHAQHVYDQITEVAKSSSSFDYRLQHAGLKALSSLRMEKGYRDYGHDMDNTDTIYDVGLSFTCDFKKDGGFVGMEHVLEQKARILDRGGPLRRMVHVFVPCLNIKSEEFGGGPMLYHGEILYRNGVPVGDIRSSSFGHTVGGGVGLAVVHDEQPITRSYIGDAEWKILIANQTYPCMVSLKPFYDPKNDRIKI